MGMDLWSKKPQIIFVPIGSLEFIEKVESFGRYLKISSSTIHNYPLLSGTMKKQDIIDLRNYLNTIIFEDANTSR